MPSLDTGPNLRTPFGKNEFLRSTRGILTESYTCASDSVPDVEIDGNDERVLQTGVLMAKITSGDDAGKVGPYANDATDGRETEANIVGLNLTFLPWQLKERDVEIAVAYACSANQERCFELDDSEGEWIELSDTGAAACQTKALQILFKPASTELDPG